MGLHRPKMSFAETYTKYQVRLTIQVRFLCKKGTGDKRFKQVGATDQYNNERNPSGVNIDISRSNTKQTQGYEFLVPIGWDKEFKGV